MTESEWLVSDSPAYMLRLLDPKNARVWKVGIPDPKISDRKLRLWVASCHLELSLDRRSSRFFKSWLEGLPDPDESQDRFLASVHTWAQSIPEQPDRPQFLTKRADLLRDIVGNPFRPVALPLCARCGGDHGMRWIDNPDTGRCLACVRGVRCLTPQVLSLAQACWDETLEEKQECPRCEGHSIGELLACPDCNNKGRTTTPGPLDPVRLAILADALEEAGCPLEERCIACPKPPKAETDNRGYYDRNMVDAVIEWGKQRKSCHCGGDGVVPHPLLASLRSPGTKYRGLWSLDLVLGLE